MKKKRRIVILGAGGFISTAIENELESDFEIIPILRKSINLLYLGSVQNLSKFLKKNDTIIFVASKAPVKNNKTLIENVNMASNFIKFYSNHTFKQFIYLSSDAVYEDKKILSEKSRVIPGSLHGLMHILRENLFSNFLNIPLTIVRPTLVYGESDPHNSYGPNSFFRKIKYGKKITLFGRGEEKRDHVYVGDVAKAIGILIKKNKTGIFNIASGKVCSFSDIAKKILKISNKNNYKFKLIKRKGPMPHLGYRSFNIKKLKKLNFSPSHFEEIAQSIFYKY